MKRICKSFFSLSQKIVQVVDLQKSKIKNIQMFFFFSLNNKVNKKGNKFKEIQK